MPLPAHFYALAPPAWSGPGRGPAMPDLNLFLSSMASSLPPPLPSRGFLRSVGRPSTVPYLCLPSVAPGKTSSVGEPGTVAGAALPHPVPAMQPDPLKPAAQLADPVASSDPFYSLVSRPPTQPPQPATTFLPDKTLSSYNPTLGGFFPCHVRRQGLLLLLPQSLHLLQFLLRLASHPFQLLSLHILHLRTSKR